MSPQRAAARVREVLLDYGDLSNPAIAAARSVLPFAQWAMKMPVGAAKMTARQPGRVATIGRTIDATLGEREQEDVYMAPGYERKRGDPRVPGPGGQAFARMAMQDVTGTPIPENQRAYINPRSPWPEIHNLLTNGIRSPRAFGETVIGQLDPFWMGAGEALLNQDVRNLRPLGQSLDQRTVDQWRTSPPWYGRPAMLGARALDAAVGDPLDPEASQRAMAQAAAHGQRNLPTYLPYLGSPVAMQLLNQALGDESDPSDPLNKVGMYRPAQMTPPEHTRALQWARLMTRWGIGLTGPDEPWRDYLRHPERDELEKVIQPHVRQTERAYPFPAR